MPKLWASTLLDLAQSVITEQTQKETQMRTEMRPEDIRKAGWALILGAILFVLSIFLEIVNYSKWSMFALLLLVLVSLPLLVFGVLGLRSRYGERSGSFGRSILLIGAILGPVTSISGFFLMTIGELWFVTFVGPAVLFTCLAMFGIVALYTKPLRRWNILPVFAGLSYPAVILFHILDSSITGDWSSSRMPAVVLLILVTTQSLALLALGYVLKADVAEATAKIA